MRKTRFYMRFLQKYFDTHYGEYGETAGWMINPAPNKWQFVVVELGLKITLTCDDDGRVTETSQAI